MGLGRDGVSPLWIVTLRIHRDGAWFDLARYFDPDPVERGPEALAHFLGLPVDEVFPISFDVREYVEGQPPALAYTGCAAARLLL